MATQLRPLPNDNLQIPRANVMVGAVGSTVLEDLGDCENVSLSIDIEEVERFARNSGLKQLRRSDILSVNTSLTIEAVDMTKFMRSLSVGSDDAGVYTQTAETAAVEAITGVQAGKIYQMPKRGLSNVTVTDGLAAVTYAEGTDYVLLEESGYIQILSIPAGADADIAITYDAAEITAADNKMLAGIGSNFDVRRQVHILSVNKVGPRDLMVLHDVQLRPGSEKAMIGEDDYATLSITGKVFVDPTQPSAFGLGYLTEISALGAA